MVGDHRIVAVIQARQGSIRFPNKVLADLNGKPVIERCLHRVRRANCLDQICVAIPAKGNGRLHGWALSHRDIRVVVGSEHNVHERFRVAAQFTKATIMVRITADCVLLDGQHIDHLVEPIKRGELDYTTNQPHYDTGWPGGMDIEAFNVKTLFDSVKYLELEDEQHVTSVFPRMATVRYKRMISNFIGMGRYDFSINTEADLEINRAIYRHLGEDFGTTALTVLIKRWRASETLTEIDQ